jgi:phosphoglycerol transferase
MRDHGKDYPRYLAFARTLWTGGNTHMLRIDGGGQVLVGVQQVKPPVLLEYDKRWNLKSVYLENTSRKFDSTQPKNTYAYVDRCTAFEDSSADGEWCALLVNRDGGIKLYHDAQLKQGIAVDAPLNDKLQGPMPRVRQPIMLTRESRRTEPGQYVLDMYAKHLPARPFWVEAVASGRNVVLAQQWVQPDADGRIRIPLGVDHEVSDLEIRAWLDYTEAVSPDDVPLALVRAVPGPKRS